MLKSKILLNTYVIFFHIFQNLESTKNIKTKRRYLVVIFSGTDAKILANDL